MTVKGEKMSVTYSWQDCVVDPVLSEHPLGNLEQWPDEIGA